MFSYEQIFANKKSILFVTAHPDDVIVYYGALIPKLASDQKNIYVLTVTDGCRGSGDKVISEKELGAIRVEEEQKALAYLGVPQSNHYCLNYKDGEVESNYKLIGEISKYIRQTKADIVCTHEPTCIYTTTYDKSGYFVQHRDHRKTAEAVVDAVYPFSRDRAFFPEQLKDSIEPHSVYEIIMTDEITNNIHLDYTEYVDKKKNALMMHKSQFDENGAQEILDSVKFGDRYEERYQYIKLL